MIETDNHGHVTRIRMSRELDGKPDPFGPEDYPVKINGRRFKINAS